jgi:hypothetical protein
LLDFVLYEIRKSKEISDHVLLDKGAQGTIEKTTDRFAELILKSVESNLDSIVTKRRADTREFHDRLRQRWKKPIDLLEVFIQMCYEAGAELNNEYRSAAAASNDYLFDVLTKLHARACQITYEVLCLLKAGLADGAHARWRTLHEIAVDAYFVKEHGLDVAKRYLLHDTIAIYKDALAYQEHCRRLGYEPLTDREFKVVETRYRQMRETYGSEFAEDYGWVPNNILSKRDFAHMEKHVKLDYLRPYYRMASKNVHSGSKGIKFKLGLMLGGRDESTLIAGPSNYGLADPGQAAAISLHQITICLLSTRTTLERLSVMKALQKLVEQLNPAFVEVQAQIEREELQNGHAE